MQTQIELKDISYAGTPYERRAYRISDERGHCDFTIWAGSDQLGSYGGSLWPHDFPAMFKPLPSGVQEGSGRVQLIGQLPA